jgi:hypothetical protein
LDFFLARGPRRHPPDRQEMQQQSVADWLAPKSAKVEPYFRAAIS